MAKNATITVRLDEDLKDEAQAVLDEMGLPMSLAIEMFLRRVTEKGALPFPIGNEAEDDSANLKRERRERDFWRAYILWNFKVWPRFDSPEAEKRAVADFEYDGKGAGIKARDYIRSSSDDPNGKMSEKQLDAYLDVSATQTLLSDAKELIYWALDMDRVFVPSLAGRYGPDCDAWRYLHLQELARMDEWDDEDDEDSWDGPVASGVIGARYFNVDGCGGEG